MAVTTRSRAAAQRGLNPTLPNTTTVEARNNIHGTAVQGAAGNRKPARGSRAKTNGAQIPHNSKEAGDSASIASRSAAPTSSRVDSRRGDDNERHMSQPRTITQTISQTCDLHVKLTFEQVATTSSAGGSSRPLPTPSPEANGAGAKKPRKGSRATTRRGPKAKAKTGRPDQQTTGTGSTVRAGTKRRREDDAYRPVDSSDDESDSASVTRRLRRVRRKTEKAAAADTPNHDGIDQAANWTRNKGKARAIDVPTTEEASLGSKRRRDEEDVDSDDASQLPLDPGPSRPTTRRTRQKVEVLTAEETKKKAIRKPRRRRTNVPPRSPITVSRASTSLSCESEEPTFVPSPTPSIERREAGERPASQGVQPEVLVKQEEVTPSLSPCQPTAGLPVEDAACEAEPSDLLSPLMLPEPLISATTPWPFAPPSDLGGSIVKEEETSSPALDRDISLSPGGSDKENDPTLAWLPQRGWSVPGIEDVPPLCQDSPDESDDDEHSSSEVEPGPSENDTDRRDENPLAYHYVVRSGPPDASDDDEYSLAEVELGPGENNADFQDGNPFDYYHVVRTGPRRPFEPLEIVTAFVPGDEESDEYDTASSDDEELMYSEDDIPGPSAPDVEIDTAQRRSSPVACNNDNQDEADANPASTRENLDDPRRCSSGGGEELLGAPSSPCSIAVPDDVDRGSTREHESLVPLVAEPATTTGSPPSIASKVQAIGRSSGPEEDEFVRSTAPSPSPFSLDCSLVNNPAPERSCSLPPCQCGYPARHFVIHSDGEASDFSFMGDDEDF